MENVSFIANIATIVSYAEENRTTENTDISIFASHR